MREYFDKPRVRNALMYTTAATALWLIFMGVALVQRHRTGVWDAGGSAIGAALPAIALVASVWLRTSGWHLGFRRR